MLTCVCYCCLCSLIHLFDNELKSNELSMSKLEQQQHSYIQPHVVLFYLYIAMRYGVWVTIYTILQCSEVVIENEILAAVKLFKLIYSLLFLLTSFFFNRRQLIALLSGWWLAAQIGKKATEVEARVIGKLVRKEIFKWQMVRIFYILNKKRHKLWDYEYMKYTCVCMFVYFENIELPSQRSLRTLTTQYDLRTLE